MPPLWAKRHKIQSLQPFLNGNVPIAPITKSKTIGIKVKNKNIQV
jgi:hypothetical protein